VLKAGNTPLHWACVSCKDVITLLIEWNASISSINNFNETPKDLIRDERFKAFVEGSVSKRMHWRSRQHMLLMLVGCKLISLSAENYLGQFEFYSLHKGVHSSVLKALSWRDFYVEILGFL